MHPRKFRSHFSFTTGERNGILFLSIVLVGLICGKHWYYKYLGPVERQLTIDSTLQARVDSIRKIQHISSRDSIYPFNPNFITDYKVYQLQLKPEVFDRIRDYRAQGKWINSSSDFQSVTRLHDSTMERVSRYLRFPEWVNAAVEKIDYGPSKIDLPYRDKIDLNGATATQLQEVYGIGPALSGRILALREKLGGFTHEDQLFGVYGLGDSVISRLKHRFAVKSPVQLQPIDLRTATASDLATIPGISFDMARRIWEYNRLREGISSLGELEKIDGLTAAQIRVISVYLSTLKVE